MTKQKCKRCGKETQNKVDWILDFGEHEQVFMCEKCDAQEREEHRIAIEKHISHGFCSPLA